MVIMKDGFTDHLVTTADNLLDSKPVNTEAIVALMETYLTEMEAGRPAANSLSVGHLLLNLAQELDK